MTDKILDTANFNPFLVTLLGNGTIRLTNPRFKESFIIPFNNSEYRYYWDCAITHLIGLGFVIAGKSELRADQFILLSTTFKSSKK